MSHLNFGKYLKRRLELVLLAPLVIHLLLQRLACQNRQLFDDHGDFKDISKNGRDMTFFFFF